MMFYKCDFCSSEIGKSAENFTMEWYGEQSLNGYYSNTSLSACDNCQKTLTLFALKHEIDLRRKKQEDQLMKLTENAELSLRADQMAQTRLPNWKKSNF